jgi:hypothetical protein
MTPCEITASFAVFVVPRHVLPFYISAAPASIHVTQRRWEMVQGCQERCYEAGNSSRRSRESGRKASRR